ncbi:MULTISPECIES: tetratricopeptide repeat protein [unclassified Cobetia]|uniref:tetratricopeptide repeat protein n=1 Tax=unclassified Cobetia TaxID=2609414 RepID=UPI00178CDEFC|nr:MULTISPECIES: tetratricopeptide repeat protein [unclassified Cobetia]MBE2167821.1 sel1 repeat family protein [Cobetia sp. 2AS1]MDH2446244.1 tetratricopeptide repeat protein [Cobetia sp. 2AS]
MKILVLILTLISSNNAFALVLVQEPTGKVLSQKISKYTEKEIKNVGSSKEKKYYLGLLTINGDKGFNIEKNCGKGVELLKMASADGVSDADYVLGSIYYNGYCVKENRDLSLKYYLTSAKDGYLLSQRALGRAYWGRQWEDLVPVDMSKSIYWLSLAAKSGDRQSAGNLSYIYRDGIGVEENPSKAFYWMKASTKAKYTESEGIGFSTLASYYELGYGTNVDLIKSYKYYDLSGTAGVDGKNRVVKNMTDAEIQEAIKQSRVWQEEHNTFVPSYYGLEHQSDGSYR